MRIHYGLDDISLIDRPVATVGSFDGVHGGHRMLLDAVKALACKIGGRSMVLTFEPHPRIALGMDEGLTLLTSVEEKALLLARAGIDEMIVVRFDSKFAGQSYEEFIRNCMIDRLHVAGLVVGYNHRFGRDNEGNFERLLPLADRFGFELRRVEQYTDDRDKVSSTVIRRLIGRGDMTRAARLLAHPYIVKGRVCGGRLTVGDRYKLLPPPGSYAALVDGRPTDILVEERSLILQADDGERIMEFI